MRDKKTKLGSQFRLLRQIAWVTADLRIAQRKRHHDEDIAKELDQLLTQFLKSCRTGKMEVNR